MIMPLGYVPLLRWRQGEYQALMRLRDVHKAAIIPLIEVLKPGYDFEERKPKKTIDEHLKTFGDRLLKKWGTGHILLEAGRLPPDMRMADGRHPLTYLFDEARSRQVGIVPVTGLDRDDAYQSAVRAIGDQTLAGVAVRCRLDEVLDDGFDAQITALTKRFGTRVDGLDIILDLESPNFEPLEGLVAVVTAALQASYAIRDARSVTIMATSFPTSMAEVKGPTQYWPRREWALFKSLIASLPADVRRPAFGDYGIEALTITEGDMRLLKPSANIRYTTNDGWLIGKGRSLRDNGHGQYKNLCQSIIDSGRYLGSGFSAGSLYLDGCSKGTEKVGNSSTWKWVGANHHITKVLHDLASLTSP